MCLRWSEQRDCCCFRRLMQGLEPQSTERHDSEHRGPAVVASISVSWKRGDDEQCVCVGLSREIAVVFVGSMQGLEHQSTDGHDSEHRGPAVVAYVLVSGTEATMGNVCVGLKEMCLSFSSICSSVGGNQLTGTIPSTVRQLPPFSIWYDFVVRFDRLSLRLQWFLLDVLGERPFTATLSILSSESTGLLHESPSVLLPQP
jgi:hypothetical protein